MKRIVHGQPSWRLASRTVEAWVTELGGHLAPVTFRLGRKKVRPFSVAPWATEKLDPGLPAILRVLRGDFFCLPFGGNSTPFRGERHPVHGETANACWKLESVETREGRSCLHVSLQTQVRRGRVDKQIFVVDGQEVVYSQHVISGMSGPMNLGHHATLRFPDAPESGLVSVSSFLRGQVFPGALEKPEERGYSILEPGAGFDALERVVTATGDIADLSRYPARRGFEDLVLIVADPELPFAWTAVAFPGERFVWFALKNPRILAETILWISNGGRHYPPWNGRHVNIMGLEEVTSYFHLGLAESARRNPLSEQGYPTSLRLDSRRPLVVPYIMGVAPLPSGFDKVRSIRAGKGNQSVLIESRSGKRVAATVHLDFLDPNGTW